MKFGWPFVHRCALNNVVCTDNEFGLERSVVESVSNLLICSGVRHPHPSQTDDTDANRVFRRHFSLR
ncbi:hypothetical protein F4167_12605 [Candidatus Poribacteria bacterium]|nr:hypothetical protein [Candidatus Poribacteria bacterium]